MKIFMRFVFLLVFLWSTVLAGQVQQDPNINKQVDSLVAINRQLIDQQKYSDALSTIEAAMALAKLNLDLDDMRLGRVYFNYGRTLDRLGHYDLAETNYLAAIKLQKDTFSNASIKADLAWSLNNLAALYVELARFDEAEKLYHQSMQMRLEFLGEHHVDYLYSLNNLGNLFEKKGDYKQAEKYHLQAKILRELHLGVKHPDYAWSLNNLGVVYKKMGRFKDAEQLYQEAINLRAEVLGKEHINYAVSLNNLGNLYIQMGEPQLAEPLYQESLQVWKKRFGEKHPYVASSLNNLAKLKAAQKDCDIANELYRDAGTIYREMLGEDHRLYALCLHNQGELAEDCYSIEEALALYEQALAIRIQTLGKDHPDYGNSQHNIARLYWKMQDFDRAGTALQDALNLQIQLLTNGSKHLSENELEAYVFRFRELLDKWYSWTQNAKYLEGDAPAFGLDLALFHKGFVLNTAQTLRHRVLKDSQALTIYHEYLYVRNNLARQYAKPVAQRSDVAALELRSTALEKEMIAHVDDGDKLTSIVKWQELQANLGKQEAVIEFVHYTYYNPVPTDSVMYAAILLKGGDAQPVFIPLFESKELDYLLQVDVERRSDYVNDLYSFSDRGIVQLGKARKTLKELIWDPILHKGLDSIKTIYIAPSGILNRINLGAIALSDEKTISDNYKLVLLNSSRQKLMEGNAKEIIPTHDALILGGIVFDPDTTVQHGLSGVDQPFSRAEDASNLNPERHRSQGTATWQYLKWTEKEASIIHSILNPRFDSTYLYTGNNASEKNFKYVLETAARSPKVIHIATHGFFFPDPASQESSFEGEPVFKWSDNPMIRSGLILSGGNAAWQNGGDIPSGMEDGILTAYEISQLNLRQTELVVLSACETGLGELVGNEGVYGLQRAFKMAGARYLMMSLWQVPDRETMEFMTTFYKKWLEEEIPIPEAFHLTQMAMRDRFINPYAWGAFVLLE